MRNPEKFEPKMKKEPDIEEKREELKDFLEYISSKLKAEGMPVENNCRIDTEAFESTYSHEILEKDKKTIKEYRKEWYGDLAESGVEPGGEDLEMLKNAIFYKNLREEFIILRSSQYDDIKNGVDNVIIERKTGNLVCALDEVGDISGDIYENKKEVVSRRNEKDGAKLKYGLTLGKEGDKEVKLGELNNLPIFYLALPEDHIEKGINTFIPNLEEKSDYEKKLFSYFITSLDSQMKALKLTPRALNPKIKERLKVFESSIKRFLT